MILARIILGFLALSPMTGYDLKRHFDSTVGHFWSADKAQIYRTLAQLVADGLAEVETVVGSARGRTGRSTASPTPDGRRSPRGW